MLRARAMVAKRAAAVAVVTTVMAIAALEVERRVVGVKALVACKAARQVAAVKVTAVAVAAYPAVRVRMVASRGMVGVEAASEEAAREEAVGKDMRSSDQPPPLCGRSGCGLR